VYFFSSTGFVSKHALSWRSEKVEQRPVKMDRWRTWNAQKLPGRAVNRYVRGWVRREAERNGLCSIEVHRTACIVTHPPGGERANMALVVPANEQLHGTRFTPEQCWKYLHGDPVKGRWDKDFVVYPTQSIDGLVTEFGGEELRMTLEAVPADAHGRRAPVGTAVVTPASHELRELYTYLIHTCAPMHRLLEPSEWQFQIRSAYFAAFDAAHQGTFDTIAMPLLGAGARGAPMGDAMRVAAGAAVSWRAKENGPSLTCRFGVQDSTGAHALVEAIEDAIRAENGKGTTFDLKLPPPAERWT
jgi:O-acetyl-ADP-ribose deacetylase (regulator of RNase III)